MHEYIKMPTVASALYVAYCVACGAYAAFSLAASVLSPGHRQRIHRGSWLHVAEGWALVGVLWAAWAWARHTLMTSEGSWAGLSPTPYAVRISTVALWVLLPAAFTALVVMLITTIVRLWPQGRAQAA
jgi:hypothetical protein